MARKTSPSYQLGRASPALVKARSTSVHHANPQVHFAPIALATDSALQLRLRLPAPEIILLHYLQIIELPRCGCHTCCSLAHSETPSSSKKELHKSHSRDDEQPALTQNLRPRLFILRTPAPSKNLPRADHRHWPQSPLNDSLDSAPKPALPFTPAPRTTPSNTTLDVTTAPANSITREHRYYGLSSAFDSLSLD